MLDTINFFKGRKYFVIIGCLILSFVMGSIHAFSVLLEPIETEFNVSRTFSSLTYSISLLSITLAVYFGKNIYYSFSPSRIIIMITILSTLGTFLSAHTHSIFLVWIGFGCLFGFANGIGYGYSLQYAAIAQPGSKALMMGLVTASYGLGSTIAPIFFIEIIKFGGFANAMISLTMVLFISNLVVLFLFKLTNLKFSPEIEEENKSKRNTKNKYLLWIMYGCSISSGLMCFGHALGMSKIFFISSEDIYFVPITMGFLNMTAGILFSSITKKFSYVEIINFLSFSNVGSLLIFFMIPSKFSLLICLFLVSISYGGTIAIFPPMINKIYGRNFGIEIYGFVFTAWGLFGFFIPLFGGWIFDIFASYSLIILFLAILGTIPLLTIKLKNRIFIRS